MKYKVGDRVRIKSLNWYNENKDKYGQVFGLGAACFNRNMSCYCGSVLTIDKAFDKGRYRMKEDYSQWIFTDGMIEGLVEEETVLNKWTGLKVELELSKTVIDVSNVESLHGERFMSGFVKAIIPPEGYIFKDENDNVINATKIVLEKKKKEYPKTYEECCEVLMGKTDFQDFELVPTKFSTNRSEENSISPEPPHISLINAFYKLLICRDAYWKIAGEEMGLGKPWKPDWTNEDTKFIIQTYDNEVGYWSVTATHRTLAFPTEEMRDAFKENFDPDIEFCNEFL